MGQRHQAAQWLMKKITVNDFRKFPFLLDAKVFNIQ
jgi:hypothetical protein